MLCARHREGRFCTFYNHLIFFSRPRRVREAQVSPPHYHINNPLARHTPYQSRLILDTYIHGSVVDHKERKPIHTLPYCKTGQYAMFNENACAHEYEASFFHAMMMFAYLSGGRPVLVESFSSFLSWVETVDWTGLD